MNSKDLAILKKLQQHTASILRYCQDCSTLSDFEADSMRVEAAVFNLMQIGELAKTSLSEEAKARIPTIPWQQLYGLRNRIVHGYAGVHMQIVWDTIAEDIPRLREELQAAVEKAEKELS